MITSAFSMLLAICANAQSQYTDEIKKEIVFEQSSKDNVFQLANISGHIKAEGYNGNKVILEAKRTIKAKTAARLEKAKEELTLAILDRYDTIIVYVKGQCHKFERGKSKLKKDKSDWGYNWDGCNDNYKQDYDWSLDFTLKVPYNMHVNLSTVNNGDVVVSGINGKVKANNINGSISIDNVRSAVYAYTINGDVDINYDALPQTNGGDSYFYTLNGDINANYPKGLKANVSFKSYNGDLFTNIDDIQYMPAVVSEKKSKDKGVSFKVDTKSLITVRGGGVALDFETFNGDVYVKEN